VFIDRIIKYKWWLFGLILLGGLATLFERWRMRREHSQDPHILAAARRYGVDPALVKAVVWRESNFDPWARGSAGEIGLMQIREPAAQEWAKAEGVLFFSHGKLVDPELNTRAGTWYLRKLLARYHQTDNAIPYALADYNAGRKHVLRWKNGVGGTNSAAFLQQMDYPGTRVYIREVMRRHEYYRTRFPPPGRRPER
jgi:soluble lytic murein transglycosylase